MATVDPKSIAIAAVCYYPDWYRGKLKSIKHTDKIRGDLLLELANTATRIGYHLVIVDGKSARSFKRRLKEIPNINLNLRRSHKRSPAKRMAFKAATRIPGVKVIVATEPEKVSAVKDCLPQIVTPILENQADVVVPYRNPELFKKTYPAYMVESEIEGNTLYNEQLKTAGLLPANVDLDLFFGVRAFKNDPKILSLFMRKFTVNVSGKNIPQEYFDTEEYSNTQYFPIVLALKRGLRVVSVEVPFKYPQSQKANEESGVREVFIEKRKNQKLSLLLELIHFLSIIKKRA